MVPFYVVRISLDSYSAQTLINEADVDIVMYCVHVAIVDVYC